MLDIVSSRKRLRKAANSARNKEKAARYAKPDQTGKLNCDHSAKAFCQAKRLSVLDIDEARGRLQLVSKPSKMLVHEDDAFKANKGEMKAKLSPGLLR